MESSIGVLRTHTCFVCGAEKCADLFEKKGWRIVRCGSCGFVFVNPRYQEDDAASVYDSDTWFSGPHAVEGGRKNYAETEVACIQRARKDIASIEKIKLGEVLLDVGCGLGYVLDAAKQRGWKVYGIDLSTYAVGVCKSKGHDDVRCGTLETVAFQPDYFDVVTAFDVFEHVCDPNKFLQDIHGVLKQDGLIVAAVPNVRSLAGMVMGKRWSQFILPEHLNYFSTSTLERILRSNHFKVIQIFSEPSITFGMRKLIRKLMRAWLAANWVEKVVDGITLFKRYVFYPPINLLVKKLGVEANLLVCYAIKEKH